MAWCFVIVFAVGVAWGDQSYNKRRVHVATVVSVHRRLEQRAEEQSRE